MKKVTPHVSSTHLLKGIWTTFLSLALLPPSLVYASLHSGVTVAGELGWGIAEVKNKQQLQIAGTVPDTFMRANLGPSGVLGRIAIGYDWGFARCWILGFDLYGALSGISGKEVSGGLNPNNSTTIKMLNSFGLRMRPGGMIGNRTMLHVTFGVDWSRWKAQASGGEFPGGVDFFAPGSLSVRSAGFTYGCGILTQIGRFRKSSLSLGLEFLRTTYKQLSLMTQPSTPFTGSFVFQTFKPFANTIAMRLVYKF